MRVFVQWRKGIVCLMLTLKLIMTATMCFSPCAYTLLPPLSAGADLIYLLSALNVQSDVKNTQQIAQC